MNGIAFNINDFDQDRTTGELTCRRGLRFNLDIDRLVLHPVPEPGAAVLLGLGLTTLSSPRRFAAGRGRAS